MSDSLLMLFHFLHPKSCCVSLMFNQHQTPGYRWRYVSAETRLYTFPRVKFLPAALMRREREGRRREREGRRREREGRRRERTERGGGEHPSLGTHWRQRADPGREEQHPFTLRASLTLWKCNGLNRLF